MNSLSLCRGVLPRFSPTVSSPSGPRLSAIARVILSPRLGRDEEHARGGGGCGSGLIRGVTTTIFQRFASSDIYKSVYSIDRIYPGCSASDVANLVHHEYAKQYSAETREKFTGYIPDAALIIKAMRSSGPGGQSVNTSNTKVEVRFNVDEADWIPLWIKKQFIQDQKHRINKRNEFVVTSERTRTQLLNQADCLDRIRHYIREAEIAATPVEIDPEEEALKMKREKKANERRLLDKKRHSLTKSGRGPL